MKKEELKRELKAIYKSLDFVSDNFLYKKKVSKKRSRMYFNIYQQLGTAWEFLGLQCKHWDGYKTTRDSNEVCRICGKAKNVGDDYYLLMKRGTKKIGSRLLPNSKKIFRNKADAKILNDTIDFHGAILNVDVNNAYKSHLLNKQHEITIAADRIVTLQENGIECRVDGHLIDIRMRRGKKMHAKKIYGGFPWEISKKHLKSFPVIFNFDYKYRFLGLSIIRAKSK